MNRCVAGLQTAALRRATGSSRAWTQLCSTSDFVGVGAAAAAAAAAAICPGVVVATSDAAAAAAAAPATGCRGSIRYHSATAAHTDTKTSSAPPPRDTRLAGRRRFYKVVGIQPSCPPWEEESCTNTAESTVESPISAGVDGTQSATGVTSGSASADAMRQLLTPGGLSDERAAPGAECGWYNVTLDGRSLRTPLGHALTVPSSTLVLAIATEWDAQDPTITPAQMPLTTMVCTSIDQISSQPQFYRDNIMRYLKNDTACYWTDPAEDRVLYRRQTRAWEDLHQWAQEHLGGASPARAMGNDEGLIMSRARKSKPGAGLPHPDVLIEEAEAWLNTLDAWRLIAMQTVTVEAKSFLVGMAVIRGSEMDHHYDESVRSPPYAEKTKDAVAASRVEEEFNIEQWGLVEGGHDYDRLNCSINIHAATFLVSSIANSS